MTTQFLTKIKQHFNLITTALVIAILFFLSRTIPQPLIQQLVQDAGIFGPLVFILLTFVTYVFAPFSGTPVLYVGYMLFGQKVVIYTTLASYLSFIVNFWLSRKFGKPLLAKLVGEESIEKVEKIAKEYGLVMVFLLRVFQGSLHDFISYAAGLAGIKFWPYFITSVIATIPGTLLWLKLSSYFDTPFQFTIATSIMTVAFTGVFLTGKYLYEKYLR